ncbi:hypothetical protein D3C71_1763650 [compost metagenome]
MRLVLGHHVGQREALRHCFAGGHIARRRHVSARVAGAAVVVELGPLGARYPRLGIELVRPLHPLCLGQHLPVQAFGDKDGGLGLAIVQDGKC